MRFSLTLILCVFIFTLAALIWDLRTRKLPNILTVPFFALGLIYHVSAGFWKAGFSGAWDDLLYSLGGFATGFCIMLILWFVGGGGGGDVKFMGALGAWLGAWLTFQVLTLSAILASSITVALLFGKVFRLQRLNLQPSTPTSQNPRKKKDRTGWTQPMRTREGWIVPFGVPAAVATWILLAIKWSGHGLPWPPF